jgi:small subunit ribosomal protein S17
MTQQSTKVRTLIGTVVSDRMDKTRVVAIERTTQHPRYHKIYRVTKRFKAHDERNEFHTGDVVQIQECRPMSKDKRWEIVKLIDNAKQKVEPISEELNPEA